MTLKCFKCGKTTGAFFRQNEKGVPGIWACDVHDQVRDEETQEVTAIIEMAVNKPKVQ